MAENALTVSATLAYSDSVDTEVSGQVNALQISIATTLAMKAKQLIGTSAEAIALGEVAPRWVWFKNLDTANYIEIYTSNAGVIMVTLLPGEFALMPLGSGVTAPYAKAHTAACQLEYCLINL